jgi:hypothetical protein
MDYASATPADSPNSWDQFWYGQIWSVPTTAVYKGLIVRKNTSSGRPTLMTVPDGTTNTLMISEKQLNPQQYDSGDWHDDQGWIDGWDPDVVRYTGFQPNPDTRTTSRGLEGYRRFGPLGRHPGRHGDGSVRMISYTSPSSIQLDGRPHGRRHHAELTPRPTLLKENGPAMPGPLAFTSPARTAICPRPPFLPLLARLARSSAGLARHASGAQPCVSRVRRSSPGRVRPHLAVLVLQQSDQV